MSGARTAPSSKESETKKRSDECKNVGICTLHDALSNAQKLYSSSLHCKARILEDKVSKKMFWNKEKKYGNNFEMTNLFLLHRD
jgi:hypothetical protein